MSKGGQVIMDKIVGQAGNLNDLVAYQAGSVVSKEIIKKDKGTVTLFAFDKGQGSTLSFISLMAKRRLPFPVHRTI